jgi:hypothetical protein
MKQFVIFLGFLVLVSGGANSVSWDGSESVDIAQHESRQTDEFENRMSQLKSRLAAKHNTMNELEKVEVENGQIAAKFASKNIESGLADSSEHLKKRFEKKRVERETQMNEISNELHEMRNELDATSTTTVYDRWMERQERKAEKLRKDLKCQREIKKKVNQEVKDDRFSDNLSRAKAAQKTFKAERSEKLQKEIDEGRYYFLNFSPSWPWSSTMFERDGFLFAQIGYQGNRGSFSSNGDRQDLAKLEYTNKDIKFKDLVVESRLRSAGAVNDAGGTRWTANGGENPVTKLKDSTVNIKSRLHQIPFALGGSIAVGDKRNVIALELPFIYSWRKLELDMALPNGVSAGANADLNRYISDPNLLLKEVFEKRKVDFVGDDRGIRFGAAKLSVSRKFGLLKNSGKALFGINASVPTIKNQGPDSFQVPRIDSMRIPNLGLFAGGYLNKNRFFNPHIYFSASAFLPVTLNRRVPHIKDHKNADTLSLLMTDFVVNTATADFKEIDSEVAMFAEELKNVKVTRPFEAEIIIGNQFAEMFDYSAFLDIFYKLRVRGTDKVKIDDEDDKRQWELDYLLFKDQEIENQIAFDWRYQKSEKTTFQVGGFYTIFGQSVPERFGFNLALRLEF